MSPGTARVKELSEKTPIRLDTDGSAVTQVTMTDQDFARICMVEEALTALGLTDVLEDLANGDEDIAELALARLCDEAPPRRATKGTL